MFSQELTASSRAERDGPRGSEFIVEPTCAEHRFQLGWSRPQL